MIRLDAQVHRTYHYWNAFVPGLRAGQAYGYRAFGAFDPARGLRFDSTKLLLDPYARAVVVPEGYDRLAASRPGDNTVAAMRSVVVDPDSYDWEGDVPLRRPFAKTVIYEVHVAGFTRHESSARGEGGRIASVEVEAPTRAHRSLQVRMAASRPASASGRVPGTSPPALGAMTPPDATGSGHTSSPHVACRAPQGTPRAMSPGVMPETTAEPTSQEPTSLLHAACPHSSSLPPTFPPLRIGEVVVSGCSSQRRRQARQYTCRRRG